MKKAIEKEKDELLNEVADAFDVKSDVSLAAASDVYKRQAQYNLQR